MPHAVNRDATFAADAHAAQRAARRAGDGLCEMPPLPAAAMAEATVVPRGTLVGRPLTRIVTCSTSESLLCWRVVAASTARHRSRSVRPRHMSAINRAVPSDVVIPRPSWPVANHTQAVRRAGPDQRQLVRRRRAVSGPHANGHQVDHAGQIRRCAADHLLHQPHLHVGVSRHRIDARSRSASARSCAAEY